MSLGLPWDYEAIASKPIYNRIFSIWIYYYYVESNIGQEKEKQGSLTNPSKL